MEKSQSSKVWGFYSQWKSESVCPDLADDVRELLHFTTSLARIQPDCAKIDRPTCIGVHTKLCDASDVGNCSWPGKVAVVVEEMLNAAQSFQIEVPEFDKCIKYWQTCSR